MTEIQPGDLVACDSSDFVGKMIRLGEWLRFRRGHQYNHWAIIKELTPDGKDWVVIQAIGRGVDDSHTLSTITPGGSHVIVPCPDGVDRAKVVEFAQAQVGDHYGWISILTISLKILLPKWFPFPTVRSSKSWICSALAGESLRFGGWLYNWPDIYTVVPSELYVALVPTAQLKANWVEDVERYLDEQI